MSSLNKNKSTASGQQLGLIHLGEKNNDSSHVSKKIAKLVVCNHHKVIFIFNKVIFLLAKQSNIPAYLVFPSENKSLILPKELRRERRIAWKCGEKGDI